MGSLASVSAPELGGVAVRAAVERSRLDPESVDEVFFGNVLSAGIGQAPARQASKRGGLPNRCPATTVNKVCGSSLQAVILGAKSIRLGDSEIVLAGGMESMSRAPYLTDKARNGLRLGHATLIDSVIHDGLWDPYNNFHMGNAAELCAKEFGIDRRAQDSYAQQSYVRALDAQKKGLFDAEIAPVELTEKKQTTRIAVDEGPGRGQPEKMASLRPVFDAAGTVTAANASSLNDGASAVLLASEAACKRHDIQPLARIVGYSAFAQAPEWFTTAPVGAIETVLRRTSLTVKDIDLFEVNEAFSVVALACMQKAGLDPEKTNVRGGAVALGHPIGASGARVLTTLLYALRDMNKRRGLATLCIGGGEAVAVVVEMV